MTYGTVPPGRIGAMNPGSESRTMMAALAAVCVLAMALAAWLAWPDRTASPPAVPPIAAAPAFQPATAQIVRVPGKDLAVINLGIGEQVIQGLLFDVYDKATGIPAPTGGNPAPPSKGFIEVVRIGPGFSECRIVRRTPGTPIVQGDRVAQRPDPAGRTAVASPANP